MADHGHWLNCKVSKRVMCMSRPMTRMARVLQWSMIPFPRDWNHTTLRTKKVRRKGWAQTENVEQQADVEPCSSRRPQGSKHALPVVKTKLLESLPCLSSSCPKCRVMHSQGLCLDFDSSHPGCAFLETFQTSCRATISMPSQPTIASDAAVDARHVVDSSATQSGPGAFLVLKLEGVWNPVA